jgi:hypothetical protein
MHYIDSYIVKDEGKGKGTAHPRTGHEGPRSGGIAILFL